MSHSDIPDAWIHLPSEEEVRARYAPGAKNHYDFGFIAMMGRLLMAHDTIGPAFRATFKEIMFGPGHLDRREREMVAAVAAAAQDCRY